ncbi:DUF1707 SHOCT-like domain-containing protein [Actinomadura sp. WAC 06369]|uniref:DUF1707 SHOCT-like domain-containing protein n=1 Tax=Actinomadura sp. WAC 06369 TaxID=2203193 RepID=UPI000F7A2E2B|nr:DUF1707 domain-containing protein [Actinomadura sp. WAC 06369]RSN51615.1 hypothetical protein DMH08_30270 [Actinomadura sp. WAC 06369]
MTRTGDPRTGTPLDGLRIGDTERDAVVVALHDHFAAGRLDRGELDERMDAALAAKTRGDLRALVRDLPPPHGLPEAAEDRPRPAPVPGRVPWGRPGLMHADPHRMHRQRMHEHRMHWHRHAHGHGPPSPAFPLLLGVFLVLTFTVGAGTGLLAVLGIAMAVWLARAVRVAATLRR